MSRCNGWTNRETWKKVLAIDNDEALWKRAVEIAKDLDHVEVVACELAVVFDSAPGENINWCEVAEHFMGVEL